MARREWVNMKANRKFVKGEEAVSAVIGVILMVAITVAIAATVYVYVSGMLTPTTTGKVISAIQVEISNDNDAVEFKITAADSGIDWTQCSLAWANGTATADALTSDGTGTAMTGNMAVGQYFWIEMTDPSGTFAVDIIYNGKIIWTSPSFTIG